MEKIVIEDEIKEIVVDHMGLSPEEVTNKSDFCEELEIDSLDNVEIIMEIEEKFDIEIPDDKAGDFKTIEDISKYINSLFPGELI